MDDKNPLRFVELGVREEVKRILKFSEESWRDLDSATDCRLMWGFVEEILGHFKRTIRIDVIAPRLFVPSTLLDEGAFRLFAWVLFADAAGAIRNLCMIRVKLLLASLEAALVARDLLTSCVLARAIVEHATHVDYVGLKLEETPLGPLFTDEASSNDFMLKQLPSRHMTSVIEKSWQGSRFNWKEIGHHTVVSLKDLEKARKRLVQDEQSFNVMTVLDDLEKSRGRAGLRADYERLCDCVHPSRGSSEILFWGKEVVEGEPFSIVYSADQPSDDAFLDRLRSLVAPAIRHTFLALYSVSAGLVRVLDELSGNGRQALAARGYDVGALYVEAHQEFARREPTQVQTDAS